MKKLLISALAAFSLSVNAQTEVATYQPGVTENGITYFLPNTCLHLTVTAKQVTHYPGKYNKFAQRYLRLNDVTTSEYDTWEITGMTITPCGVANKEQAYSIKLKSKTSAPLVGLAPDGRLLSINAETPELPKLSVAAVAAPVSKKMESSDYLSQEILLAGSTSKMAELTADEIFDIRDNRAMLAKGQADFMPKDGEQLRLMLQNLDVQEQALLQLFKGYTTEVEHTFTFDFVPKGEVKNEIIFRFSKHLGVVDIDDLGGAPISVSVRDLKSLPPLAEEEAKKKEVEDVRYIVPGRAEVKLFYDNLESTSIQVPMAQFGRVEHLGGKLFDKQMSTSVMISPDNGGIVKIEMAEQEK